MGAPCFAKAQQQLQWFGARQSCTRALGRFWRSLTPFQQGPAFCKITQDPAQPPRVESPAPGRNCSPESLGSQVGQSEGAKGRESGSVPSCTDGLSGSCCWPWWSLSMKSLFDTKPSSLTAQGSLALWDALPGVTPCTPGLRCSQQERLRASPALLAGSCPCGTWGQGKGGKEGKEGKR